MHHHSASWMQRLRNEDLSPTAAGPEWYNEWKWVGVEGEHGGGEEYEGAGEEAGMFFLRRTDAALFIMLFCSSYLHASSVVDCFLSIIPT